VALDRLGVGAEVRERAAPPGTSSGMRDRHGRALLAADQSAVVARAGAPFAVVARSWLHRLLATRLPDGAVRTGIDVTDVTALDGDAVIVADGARSRIRPILFPGHPGLRGSGEIAAQAIATRTPEGLVSGEFLDHRTGERTGALTMSDGRTYWYATWREAVVGPTPTDPAERVAWLAARRRDWHPALAPMIAATPADAVHVGETAQLAVPLTRFHSGRIALLGDAAHAMTPDLGQGGGQAFEDAVTLRTVLTGARAQDVPAALARYSALRVPRTSELLDAARSANRMLGMRGPQARLRDTVMRLVPQAAATRMLARQLRFEPL
jgi:2-polyprenyl-6-methoxyphenol hydroxylase-like FAD-dependent oxidoreductase